MLKNWRALRSKSPITAFFGSGAEDVAEVRIDASTQTLIGIAQPHHKIHDGNHFFMEGWTELDTDAILRVKLVTPNTTKWGHFTWTIRASGILETTLHEDASGAMTGGSGVTPLNSNRNSTNVSGIILTSGVTAADTAGTLISNVKLGGTGFKESAGGAASRDDELILKQNTIYLRTFTSRSDDNFVSFRASWYEHTDKN